MTPDRKKALREGSMSVDKRARNIVEAFQTALREKYYPTFRVTGFKPFNATNIRVTYTSPVFDDKPQRAMLHRLAMGYSFDPESTWAASYMNAVTNKREKEIVRFLIDELTGEYVKVL